MRVECTLELTDCDRDGKPIKVQLFVAELPVGDFGPVYYGSCTPPDEVVMRQDQVEILDALEKANVRLVAARKELGEALADQDRTYRKARSLCPNIFNISTKKDNDDE